MKGLVILLISVLLAVFTCGVSILLTDTFALIDAILIASRLNRAKPLVNGNASDLVWAEIVDSAQLQRSKN